MEISIITINYKVRDKILDLLRSIEDNPSKVTYEIIVVDNEGDKALKKSVKNFKNVIYIKSKRNLGFGGGNNLGASVAKGKYLFFLNPDTLVIKNAVEKLYNFLENNKKAGIVSPLVLGKDKKPLDRQGYKELNFINGFFSFSFMRKRFRRFSVSSFYSLKDWDKEPVKKIETVYGAALMIPKEVFKKVSGFDEDFFLYFEENDLSKRVRKLGLDLFIDSNSRIIHEVGQSTRQMKERDEYFEKSRYLYFKKHFGIFQATFLELLLKINKYSILLSITLLVSLFLRLYKISQSMVFIGDQGWFYLSARDLLVYGKIPLVGITSSHTWLHQGPLWTYMLSVALFIFNFNPIAGAFVTAIFGVSTTFLLYKLGSLLFNRNTGLIAAVLYSVSPLVVLFDRMPFDPSPIPFFALLYLFSFVKWVQDNTKYFPLTLFLLAILYNLELATFTLFFPLLTVFIYGLFKKEKWISGIFKPKMLFSSFVCLIFPMIPVILYDFSNGFKQTLVFAAWTFYKPLSIVFHILTGSTGVSVFPVINFLASSIQAIIFSGSFIVSVLMFLASLIYLIFIVRKKTFRFSIEPKVILFILLFFSLGGIVAGQTPSSAYLPVVVIYVIFTVSLFLEYLISVSSFGKIVTFFLLLVFILNAYSSFKLSLGYEFKDRMDAVDKIIALTKGTPYNLRGEGIGSQFETLTMNYEYLLWWKGFPPQKAKTKLQIYIREHGKIYIRKAYD